MKGLGLGLDVSVTDKAGRKASKENTMDHMLDVLLIGVTVMVVFMALVEVVR